MTAYPHLFQPIDIGPMTVKNRLLMSAMSINFGVDEQGRVTDQLIQYLAARARGGVGMMLVGGGGIHPSGVELPNLPALWDDGCIPALKRLTDTIRPLECRLGMQLMHGGRQSYHDDKVAPSAIPAPAVVRGVPRALTEEEIHMLADAFGRAAARCRAAGFDFIEIHGAHGYLINQFLAPNSNQRTDAYGGAFENRIRFLLEVMAAVRAHCGDDFPMGMRINAEDYIDNGWGQDEALRLAPIIQSRGAAYLHVSAGVYGSRQLTIPSMYVPQGCFADLAAAVKAGVSLPVVAVGRIKSPRLADEIIADGKADLVALGRSLLADPSWPAKARAGTPNRIRPCVGCCLGCIHTVLRLEPGGCVVNPDVGREYLLKEIEPAATPRRVLVVGAGPAGLAAARMAALRGHQVSVCDQAAAAGGALRLAALPPGRSDLAELIDYFVAQLEQLAVPLRLNTPLDDDLLDQVAPQVVVLATGSLPEMPLIKGLYRSRMQVCTVTEVLSGQSDPGQRILVYGGNQAGLVLADFLATRQREVTVLHPGRHFGEEMSSNDRFYLRERLNAARVTLHKQVTVAEFVEKGVRFKGETGPGEIGALDTVVLADKFAPLREAANRIRARGLQNHFIGDAKTPRHLMYAVAEGEEIGREL